MITVGPFASDPFECESLIYDFVHPHLIVLQGRNNCSFVLVCMIEL